MLHFMIHQRHFRNSFLVSYGVRAFVFSFVAYLEMQSGIQRTTSNRRIHKWCNEKDLEGNAQRI